MDNDGGTKKRNTERQITKEDYQKLDAQEEQNPGQFERATAEELKTRQIRRVRRSPAPAVDTSQQKNPFAGISLVTSATNTEQKELDPSKEDDKVEKDVEQAPLEKIESGDPPLTTEEKKGDEDGTETNEKVKDSATKSSVSTSLFTTPLTSVITSEQTEAKPSAVDLSQFKPLEVVQSGEESEETVYQEQASLFLSEKGQWKSVGSGNLKINVDQKNGARFIMRQNQTLKLLLNARLYPEMKCVPMGNDAVTFVCQNTIQPLETSETTEDNDTTKHSIFAVRFKNDAKEKVQAFQEMVEKHKTNNPKD